MNPKKTANESVQAPKESVKSLNPGKSVIQTKKSFHKYDSYKDSGIDWLGEIPEEWKVKRIKYIFNEINERSELGTEDLLSVSQYTGVTRKIDKTSEGNLITNASTLEGYKKVSKGDLVSNIMLAWNGSLGISNYDGITSPAYSIYRLKKNCNNTYFHYLFRTELYKAEFKRNSSGIIESRLRLYTEDFYSILSILPPLSTQTAITAFLDSKTSKIERAITQKEKMIALLKERKQIIIQDAVTGKVLNYDSNDVHEHYDAISGKQLPIKIKVHQEINPNHSSRPMKDSGVEWIGEIPSHWEVKRLKYVLNLSNEKVYSLDSDLPYVGMENIESKSGQYIQIKSDAEGLGVVNK